MKGNVIGRILIIAAIFGCLVISRRGLNLKLQRGLQVAIIALLWLDIFTHTSNLSPTAPRAVLKPDNVRKVFGWDHQLNAGSSRALESQDSLWKIFSMGSTNLATDTYYRRQALPQDFNLLDHVPKFDGFYSLDLKEHVDVFKRVFFTTNDAPKLKDFVGISYVSNPTNILDWVPRDSFLPLVTAGQKPVFVADEDALANIFTSAFEPTRIAYFPPEAADKIHATEQPDAKANLIRFSAQRLDIHTDSDAPAIVTIAQTFYHPWHAYVDGRRTRLWRANYAFQALEVPPGKHEVRLAYEDADFLWGAALSALSVFVCVAMWWWLGRNSVMTTATSEVAQP
jgi:hypothetical protein